MSKQSKITNLLVMPLIASAVFFASPALAANPARAGHSEIRNATTEVGAPGTKRGIAGTVASVNGTIIIVTSKDNVNYTVDASQAMIMKASAEANVNPSVVGIADIKVGDSILVRGTVTNTEVAASKIFDGKPGFKKGKHLNKLNHLNAKRMNAKVKAS